MQNEKRNRESPIMNCNLKNCYPMQLNWFRLVCGRRSGVINSFYKLIRINLPLNIGRFFFEKKYLLYAGTWSVYMDTFALLYCDSIRCYHAHIFRCGSDKSPQMSKDTHTIQSTSVLYARGCTGCTFKLLLKAITFC